MTREFRAEVLWRAAPGRWDNAFIEALAEAAEDTHDWLISRWEDGPEFGAEGVYVTGYVTTDTPAAATDVHGAAVQTWMAEQGVAGYVAGLEAIEPDVATLRAEKPTVPELASATDAAAILEVSRQRVNELARTHPAFPAPLAHVATGPLWTRRSIERFAATRERNPGRPRRPHAA